MSKWKKLQQTICECQHCPRLIDHCQEISRTKRKAYLDFDYWGKPVPNFGNSKAQLLIVGLAPGAHGANRTGRMFTGDRSGDWLYRALHKAGFANQAEASTIDDGLKLNNCVITAVAHCAPPQNKPTKDEILNCHPYLEQTIDILPVKVFIALGQIAWKAVWDEAIRRDWAQPPKMKFGHANEVMFDKNMTLIGSYHPSQQNTFTGRLTEPMLDQVFTRANEVL